jgi:aminocarboxymuconate-semialdehyde decarboxylase
MNAPARQPVVDAHAHIVTPSVGSPGALWTWMGNPVERAADGRLVTTTDARPKGFKITHEGLPEGVDARVAEMDTLGIDVQIISLLPSLWLYGVEGHDTVHTSRLVNDDLIRIAERHPRRFRVFAHLPLDHPDDAVSELERVSGHELVVGAAVGTNVAGVGWDEASLFPVLAAAERLGSLVFFHPMAVRFPPRELRRYHLGNLIGNPSDTTLAVAQLLFGGVLERLPRLSTLFAHGGGYAPYAIGRFDHGFRERGEARVALSEAPSVSLRRMYFDNLLHDDAATRYLIETVGADHVVLGTDYPADMGPADPTRAVLEAPGLDDVTKAAILGGNLVDLLGLDPGAIGRETAGS